MTAASPPASGAVLVRKQTLRETAAAAQVGTDSHRLGIAIIGWVALATGPLMLTADDRTPSFALFARVPGWPEVVGLLISLAGAAVLACRAGGHRVPAIGATGLYMIGALLVTYGLTLLVTYGLWVRDIGLGAWWDYFVTLLPGGAVPPREGKSPPILMTAPAWIGGGLLVVIAGSALRVRARKGIGRPCVTAPPG